MTQNKVSVPRRERIRQPNSTRELLPLSLSGMTMQVMAWSKRTLICNQAVLGKSFWLGERIAATKLCQQGNDKSCLFSVEIVFIAFLL
jgi:hypothetical protein